MSGWTTVPPWQVHNPGLGADLVGGSVGISARLKVLLVSMRARVEGRPG